jgi:hypothetical protein
MNAQPKKRDNRVLYFLYNILYTTGFMFCSGTVHTDFSALGRAVTESEVYIYNAVIQFVQVVVILGMNVYKRQAQKTC